jgi:hypothetical protein
MILQSMPQTADAVEPPRTEAELAQYSKREWLDPVLGNLRRKAQGDQDLLKLLGEVEIWTRKGSPDDWRPDASAQLLIPENKPIIYVNLPFLEKSSMLADLAGLSLTGRNEAKPVVYQAGFNYGKALIHAKANNLETPLFFFKIDEAIDDQVLRVMTRSLSDEVFFGATTWVVLHELAHHRLGHTKRKQQTYKMCYDGNLQACSQSRKMELDADKLAFAMMRKLGYGLAPLHAFFLAHEAGQEIRFMAQAEPLENCSTHPSFATRRKELEKLYTVSEPPQGDFLIILTFSQKKDQVEAVETLIPRHPESEGWLFAIHDRSNFLSYEWRDGEIHLYGRSPESLSEIIVHQPGKLKPEMTFRVTRTKDGFVDESRANGFQVDYASIQHVRVGSLTVSGILETSPYRLFSNALAQVESRPDVRNAAGRIYGKQLQDNRKVLIRYARGQGTLADAQKQIKATNEIGIARLKITLGDSKYAQLRDLLLGSPEVKVGLDQWIHLKPN